MPEEEEVIDLDWDEDKFGVIENFGIVDPDERHPLLAARVNKNDYKVLALRRLYYKDGMLKVGKGMDIRIGEGRAAELLLICEGLVVEDTVLD